MGSKLTSSWFEFTSSQVMSKPSPLVLHLQYPGFSCGHFSPSPWTFFRPLRLTPSFLRKGSGAGKVQLKMIWLERRIGRYHIIIYEMRSQFLPRRLCFFSTSSYKVSRLLTSGLCSKDVFSLKKAKEKWKYTHDKHILLESFDVQIT